MGEQTSVVTAEWQPSLACFCPSCKLHVNILRVPVEPGSVKDVELTVGAAFEGELLALRCPNCASTLLVKGVKAGRALRLTRLLGEGSAESSG